MIDQREQLIPVIAGLIRSDEDILPSPEVRLDLPFSRSNGTMLSRLYERLTKASRRRAEARELDPYVHGDEYYYRKGVYDAYKALQDELEA